ncbi:uncharacterized protein FN964_008637 isoform 1-T2 [Alca torda]
MELLSYGIKSWIQHTVGSCLEKEVICATVEGRRKPLARCPHNENLRMLILFPSATTQYCHELQTEVKLHSVSFDSYFKTLSPSQTDCINQRQRSPGAISRRDEQS